MAIKKEISIKELKSQISKLKKVVKMQENEIIQFRSNNIMNMYTSIQAIIGEYSILLDPEPNKIKATFKNKGELFEVRTSNILCIISEGREKLIILKKPIYSYGGNENRVTSVISVSKKWVLLLKEIDRIGFHLFQINKSVYVNVRHFSFENGIAVTKSKLPEKYDSIEYLEVSKNHEEHFRERRENYLKVFRLQKVLVDYKVKNGYLI